MASSLCKMPSGEETPEEKKIDKMKWRELSITMDSLGISDENVENLRDARSKIRTTLNETPKKSNWSPKQAFSVLCEAMKEDDRKRQVLLSFYARAEALLGEMDEQMLNLLQKHVKNLKPRMRWHEEQLKQRKYFLLVAGEMSSGKSSLINLILGKVILPFDDTSTTSTICELKFGREKKMIAHFKEKDPETGHVTKIIPLDEQTGYREQISNYVHKEGSIYSKVELFWPHELLETGLVIIDSPGVGDSDEMDNMVIQYLPEAFAFIYVANSSLGGGVQKDKLEKLLQKARYVLMGVAEEEKDESSEWVDVQEELLSKCALFVCNKWDQLNENLGTESVKDEITKKLKKAWPGVDPDSQIIYMSTKHDLIAQDLGVISKNFSALMDKMRSLVLRSIQAKHELHWRWLDKLLSRIFFQAKAHVINTSASPEEIKKRLDKIVRRLEAIEEDQEKVIKEFRKFFGNEVDRVVQRLSEHLSSNDVKERFTSWSLDEAPAKEGSWTEVEEKVNTLVSRRFHDIVDQLEEEHKVFENAYRFLMQRFQNYYDDVEFKLQNLQGDATEFESGKKTFRIQISPLQKIGWVVKKNVSQSLNLILSVVTFKIENAYLQFKGLTNVVKSLYKGLLSDVSAQILADCTNKTKLKPFVEEKLKDAKLYLDRIEARLPEMIRADRDLYEQLTKEKDELSRYQPVFLKVSKHRNELALFGLTEVCAENIDCKKLEWKEEESSYLGSGSFGAVYQGKMRSGDGKVTTVALKVSKGALDVNNAVKIMEETKKLRLLESRHIVQFYGISLVKDTLQTVLVMEKCKVDLRHFIFRELKSPSRSKDPAVFNEVCRLAKQITDGLAYIHEKGIVHRDLKLENILLSEDNTVKIADVGLAKAEIDITGTFEGTPIYMAPEVFHSQVCDTKADIYSLGLIMWEMWYGHRVFADVLGTKLEDFFDWVDKGNRPVEMHGCQTPPSFWKLLMTQCWDGNLDKRPTAKECHERMVKSVSPESSV